MAPNESNKHKGAAGKEEEDDSFVLQAVVLTDSFERRFRPITLETPRCLFPVANTPLINYTLNFLADSGVEEVFLFCCSQAEKVEAYLKTTKWMGDGSPFKKFQIIVNQKLTSMGDAMRELDGKGLITGDFLLITADVVTNMVIGPALQEHRARRAKNKDAIMTMVLRESQSSHRTMDRGDKAIFVLDKANGRCLHYERILPDRQKPFLSLPAEVLQAPTISIRDDLLDCYIDICSQDVPALFTENFDYQHIRGHFVHGILQDHELYGKTIHCYITRKDYIARVRGLQTYDAITKDIVSGWAYPICVDHNLFDDMDYTKTRNHIYRENDVTLTRSSLLKPNTVVGAHTSVGENTVLSGSVIGRQCKIGENVKVDGAYIWDHVQIGNNCDIGKSIIASNVVLGENVKVMPGAVISHNVTIAPGTTVYSDYSITTTNGIGVEEEQETDVGVVGEGGRGFLYEDSESDSDEIERIAASRLPHQKRTALLTAMEDSDSDSSYISSSDESTFSEVSSASASRRRAKKSRQRSRNSVTTARSDYSATSNDDDPDESFFKEAYSSLLTALEANHPVEVAALELNSLRMSSNASFDLVRRAVATAFVAQLGRLTTNVKLAEVKDIVLAFAKQWHSLCKRTVFSPTDQVELILELQKASLGLGKDFGTRVFGYTLQGLYNEDVLPEESILAWQKHPTGRLNNGQEVRSIADQFANWLASAESDDSDDESGEEETDDEEEESDAE